MILLIIFVVYPAIAVLLNLILCDYLSFSAPMWLNRLAIITLFPGVLIFLICVHCIAKIIPAMREIKGEIADVLTSAKKEWFINPRDRA